VPWLAAAWGVHDGLPSPGTALIGDTDVMTRTFSLGAARLGLLCALLSLWACSGKDSNQNTTNSNLAPGEGYCQDTCTKDCTRDQDCEMSNGEMCCKIGEYGSTCLPASQCPVECVDETKCNTKNGQACERTTLVTQQTYCALPSSALQMCDEDGDCTNGKVCCGNYKERICLDPSLCPKACSDSTECDTAKGELCCTSVGKIEPNLNVPGLCVNTNYTLTSGYSSCPKTCTKSSECDNASNEVCCNGLCTTNHDLCPKVCKQSSDCNGQLCCKSALMRMPDPSTHVFTSGPSCKGTPSNTCSSSSCYSVLGCNAPGTCTSNGYSCATFSGDSSYQTFCTSMGCTYNAPTSGSCAERSSTYTCASWSGSSTTCTGMGCTYTATTGTCNPYGYTCSTFSGSSSTTSQTYCTSMGCDYSPPTGSCISSGSYLCSDLSGSSSSQSYCTDMGCTFDSSTNTCSGTPTACSTYTSSTACSANVSCYWSSSGSATCSGTPIACNTYTSSTACDANEGCYWSSSSSGTCTGTPTPCSSYTSSSACDANYNCNWTTSPTCTGTPTACETITNSSDCAANYNCDWSPTSTTCTGTPTPCSQLTELQCAQQTGCYWQ